MTPISLPADPTHAKLDNPQAVRAGLAIDQVRALLPVADVPEERGATLGEAAIRHGQTGALEDALGTAAQNGAATASARESFSAAARTILNILADTDSAPVRGTVPVVATPPSDDNSGGVYQLMHGLLQAVDKSGVFYESHLQAWVDGKRSLADLQREPQAALNPPATQARAAGQPHADAGRLLLLLPAPQPADPSAAPAHTSRFIAPPRVVLAADMLQRAPDPSTDSPFAGGNRPVPPTTGHAATPRDPPQAAQAYQAMAPQATPVRERGELPLTQLPAPSRTEKAESVAVQAPAPASTGPAVHPDATPLIRQQLETLAAQQFRWHGEVWPGTPLDWRIARQADDQPGDGPGAEREGIVWTTALALEFPGLGTVHAQLALRGNHIEARLEAPGDATIDRMSAHGTALRERLEGAGLSLGALSIKKASLTETGETA